MGENTFRILMLANVIIITIHIIVLAWKWQRNNTSPETSGAKSQISWSEKLGALSSGLTCISSPLVALVSAIALWNLAAPSYKAGDPGLPEENTEFGEDEHDDFDRQVREALTEHKLGNIAVAESKYKEALGFSEATQAEAAELRMNLAKITSDGGRKLEAWAHARAAIDHLELSADNIHFYAGISINLCELNEALVWLNRLPKPLGNQSVELKQRAEDPATMVDCEKEQRKLR